MHRWRPRVLGQPGRLGLLLPPVLEVQRARAGERQPARPRSDPQHHRLRIERRRAPVLETGARRARAPRRGALRLHDHLDVRARRFAKPGLLDPDQPEPARDKPLPAPSPSPPASSAPSPSPSPPPQPSLPPIQWGNATDAAQMADGKRIALTPHHVVILELRSGLDLLDLETPMSARLGTWKFAY